MSTLKLENLQHPDAAGTSISLASSGAISFASDVAFNTDTFYVDTANGRVGIGTSSPAKTLDVVTTGSTAPRITGASGEGSYIDIHNNAATTNGFRIGQGFASVSDNVAILNNKANAALVFCTDATERMRIDSSGNLLVGTTSASSEFTLSGRADITNAGLTQILNRTGTDGDIVLFRKDGSTVGSIGTDVATTDFVIDGSTGHSGLRFGGADITPRDGGSDADDAIQLGSSTNRFSDLYLSGGVYVGGTTSANKLDDYEEGTFTATISDAISGGNTSSTSVTGTYTKVGRMVVARFNLEGINTSGMTGANAVYYHLPFTSSSSMTLVPGIVQTANVNIDAGFQFCAILDSNANRGRVDEMRDATSATSLLINDLTSGSANLRIMHTYFVD